MMPPKREEDKTEQGSSDSTQAEHVERADSIDKVASGSVDKVHQEVAPGSVDKMH